MLLSLFAIKVFQYKSVSAFLRELARNPSLMKLPGFPLRRRKPKFPDEYRHEPFVKNYRVASNAAMSRFQKTLIEVNHKTGCLDEVYAVLVEQLKTWLPDYGQRIGYDGKAVESHSTGRQLKHKRIDKQTGRHPTSDPSASWGVHSQYVSAKDGKEKKITKRGYGFELHLLADVKYELPISFKVASSHESESQHCQALVDEFLHSDLAKRSQSFVVDKALDSNRLRLKLYDNGIIPVIDTRNFWQDENPHPEQLKTPTRARYAIKRINSRIDSNFQMHDHHIRGIDSMRMHILVGMTAMTAGACFAIRNGCP